MEKTIVANMISALKTISRLKNIYFSWKLLPILWNFC